MGCLLVLASLISARLAVFLTWAFTSRMSVAFTSGWIGFIGFLFLPWTTLAWTWMYLPAKGSVEGFGVFVVILAFFFDLASLGSGDRERRQRYR